MQPRISRMVIRRRDGRVTPSPITETARLSGVTLGSIFDAVGETLLQHRAQSIVVYLRNKHGLEVEYEVGWVEVSPHPILPWVKSHSRRRSRGRRGWI